MTPIHTIGFILCIIVIILIIVGVHYAVNNDSVDRESKSSNRLIYILSGIFCVLILSLFLVLASKSK